MALVRAKTFLKKTAFLLVMLAACMLAAFGILQMGLRTESVFMIFIVGITIMAVEVSGFMWSLVLGLMLVMGYNYFFTAPYFTLMVYDANYYVTWLVFIIVGIIVSTLASRLRREAIAVQANQKTTEWLYRASTGYLNFSDQDDICAYTRRLLEDLLGRDVRIVSGESSDDEQAAYCYNASLAVGHGEPYYTDSPRLYLPLKSKNATLGVVCIECGASAPTPEERRSAEAAITLAVMALERSTLEEAAREDRLDAEREKLRNNLLRSVSHDLRTPLTSIAGNADFLLANGDQVDEKSRFSLLSDISADAVWLTDMVENLQAMTRVQDGRVPIEKKNEGADDVISGAASRTRKRCGDHRLAVHLPDESVRAPMDGTLVTQVLVNLIDNAIKHTRSRTTIDVSARNADGAVEFTVSDDGGGVPPDKLERIFDSFYSVSGEQSAQQNGMGLGLAICRAIVEAHGGTIDAANNAQGGATFTFTIPRTETDGQR